MAGKVRGTVTTATKGQANAKNGVLSRPERVKLMAETLIDERTIRKWERGEDVRPGKREILERAARKLDIPIPEKAA
jgi:hypothetical protein